MTQTTHKTSAEWDQAVFEKVDRRGVKRVQAVSSVKQHDLVHLVVDPSRKDVVHAVVGQHSRHTDSVHAHGDSLVVVCPPGDAAGLRTKLELVLADEEVPVVVSHGTFPAGSDISQNVVSLNGG
jgi:hypothetical protein